MEIERGRRGCPTVRRRCRKDCAAANLGWIHGDRSRFPENRRNIPPRVTTFATMENRGPVDLDALIREASGPGQGSLLVRVTSREGVPIGWASAGVRRLGVRDGFLVMRGWSPSGVWTADELPTGEYEFAIVLGAAMQAQRFSIRDGERTELALDLRFGTPVEIEAVAAPGELPLRRLTFAVHDTDGGLQGSNSWNGHWRGEDRASIVVALSPGQYVITASAADGRSGETRVLVPESGGTPPRVRIEIR